MNQKGKNLEITKTEKTNWWKTHPKQKAGRDIWMSFPEIGLCHTRKTEILEKKISFTLVVALKTF